MFRLILISLSSSDTKANSHLRLFLFLLFHLFNVATSSRSKWSGDRAPPTLLKLVNKDGHRMGPQFRLSSPSPFEQISGSATGLFTSSDGRYHHQRNNVDTRCELAFKIKNIPYNFIQMLLFRYSSPWMMHHKLDFYEWYWIQNLHKWNWSITKYSPFVYSGLS